MSGTIQFVPLERPHTDAARIFYSAPDTPPILPIGSCILTLISPGYWLASIDDNQP